MNDCIHRHGCICNIHYPVVKYSMCAQCGLKWSSRYLPEYVGAQNGCACLYVFLLINVFSSSSAFAVAGKELVEQQLERHVLDHDVVFAQVVTAGGAGVNLRSERPLETTLANIVRAGGGDGLEGQLLAADTHEDLLHLAQEIRPLFKVLHGFIPEFLVGCVLPDQLLLLL